MMSNILGSKKLYRVPEEGRVKGVCAGLAHYFDVPVRLIRVMAVLSLFSAYFYSLWRPISRWYGYWMKPQPVILTKNSKNRHVSCSINWRIS